MRGYTLIELIAVLMLLAVGVSALAPTARRLADLSAVNAAREELVALLSEARAVAMRAGASTVTVAADPPLARIEARGVLLRSFDFGSGRAVGLSLGSDRDSVSMRFDGLGLGRFSSQTIEVSRGEISALVVVSSYGRVRRQ